MSNATSRLAAVRAARSTAEESAMPLPGTIFSAVAYARWVEATSTVRSGVTRPRWIARPASIHSAAITRSTSPPTGISAITGSRPSGSGSASST